MSDSAEDVLTSEQGAGPAVSARVAKLAQDIYDEFQNIIGLLHLHTVHMCTEQLFVCCSCMPPSVSSMPPQCI